MSWSDEFFNGLASGKDPPEERKSRIKKLIREELNKNPVLSNVLRENKAEGKFIKELTDKLFAMVGATEWQENIYVLLLTLRILLIWQ